MVTRMKSSRRVRRRARSPSDERAHGAGRFKDKAQAIFDATLAMKPDATPVERARARTLLAVAKKKIGKLPSGLVKWLGGPATDTDEKLAAERDVQYDTLQRINTNWARLDALYDGLLDGTATIPGQSLADSIHHVSQAMNSLTHARWRTEAFLEDATKALTNRASKERVLENFGENLRHLLALPDPAYRLLPPPKDAMAEGATASEGSIIYQEDPSTLHGEQMVDLHLPGRPTSSNYRLGNYMTQAEYDAYAPTAAASVGTRVHDEAPGVDTRLPRDPLTRGRPTHVEYYTAVHGHPLPVAPRPSTVWAHHPEAAHGFVTRKVVNPIKRLLGVAIPGEAEEAAAAEPSAEGEFSVTNPLRHGSGMKMRRCRAQIANGSQCKRRATDKKFCAQHEHKHAYGVV